MEGRTGVQLIREFFGTDSRPVSLAEMKNLTAADRKELVDAIADQWGLSPINADGKTVYV